MNWFGTATTDLFVNWKWMSGQNALRCCFKTHACIKHFRMPLCLLFVIIRIEKLQPGYLQLVGMLRGHRRKLYVPSGSTESFKGGDMNRIKDASEAFALVLIANLTIALLCIAGFVCIVYDKFEEVMCKITGID
jgi:hypothetical protein